MSPPYTFRITEVKQNPNVKKRFDCNGKLVVHTAPETHEIVRAGVTGKLWHCDSQNIHQISQFPPGSAVYKTFSVYYVGGDGFWVLKGDALAPPRDDVWHPLRFDHSTTDWSSFLTNAGGESTLRCQRNDQSWPSLLLPDIYHTPKIVSQEGWGGLTGELPIFLALLAHSTSLDYLPLVLPHMFINGSWIPHNHNFKRTDQRGVVVTVYTCPRSRTGGPTSIDLAQYEQGDPVKYFP
ncbi:hypothetical protein P153DRAFT_112573 [Dothidotthia symphoricarpi CBS 119687]|uniref:Uncharacterized protein n=1 Tax=Dothidotthia symphoricarpi CBS 119687 TaxID=1392245 RepID=A0A6A6A2I1_9PLEO|nr:uncharacterized protein P153DRAFT_112573 [Dothidotthia symphoricarpi CBS 119687]KAF2125405.1 hypothetical protein P153DRAFT_112573 [Dothidotthia symphoricarpi CBS 119687]